MAWRSEKIPWFSFTSLAIFWGALAAWRAALFGRIIVFGRRGPRGGQRPGARTSAGRMQCEDWWTSRSAVQLIVATELYTAVLHR